MMASIPKRERKSQQPAGRTTLVAAPGKSHVDTSDEQAAKHAAAVPKGGHADGARQVAAAGGPRFALMPFVAAPGNDVPELELAVRDLAVDPEHLAAYIKVCGLELSGRLPATYPHALAFPMHMALMTDQRFPFPAIGLVHIENRITQHRPLGASERLSLRVSGRGLEPHPKGRKFCVITEARVGGELVWGEASTYLRRGSGSGGDGKPAGLRSENLSVASEWQLPDDLGRRYAAVSGDHNPDPPPRPYREVVRISAADRSWDVRQGAL